MTKVEKCVESLKKSVQLIENKNQEFNELLNEKSNKIIQLEKQIESLNQREKWEEQSKIIENLERNLSDLKIREQMANSNVETLQKTLGTFASNSERSDLLRQKFEEQNEYEKKEVSVLILYNMEMVCFFFTKRLFLI